MKRRVSAFAGSDVGVILRAGQTDHLVLTGIATSGVVLSTLRQAADLDFGLAVLADGCLGSDPEVHRVLTDKVFPRQADVTTVAGLDSSGPARGLSRPSGRLDAPRCPPAPDRQVSWGLATPAPAGRSPRDRRQRPHGRPGA